MSYQAKASRDEDQPLPDEDQPLSDEDQPLSDEDQPLPDENQPLPDEDQPLPDENPPLSDNDQPLPDDDDQSLPDDDQPLPDDDQPLPDDNGSKERKILLTTHLAEADERHRLHKEQMEEIDEKLIQLKEELKSRKKQSVQEWQDITKELNQQQDQLRHSADFLQSNQHKQLSEALGCSEERPNKVLAHIADKKWKVAAAELEVSVIRHEQLNEYHVQARDLAGRLSNFVRQLEIHIVALKEREKALEELESCGEKYTKELTECHQKLEQLQEKVELALAQLRSCKKMFQEYKEKIDACLDEMNACEGTLSLDLRYCLVRVEKLRKKLTDELLNLEGGMFQNVLRLFGYRNDQLERKKAELQKCSTELEETERTLEECQVTVQKFKEKLVQLKERVKKANVAASRSQDPPTGDHRETQSEISASQATWNWEYRTMYRNFGTIISALAANSLANTLAGELKSRKLIGAAVYARATNHGPGITEYRRVKQIITAMLSKIEHNSQRYYDFIDVLKLDRLCADAEAALKHLPTVPPKED